MHKEPSGVWIMAYTTINDPSAHFQTLLYTGNASSRSLTNDGNSDLQPDLVWTKKRNEAQNHCVTDSTRGVGNIIFPDASDAESATQLLTSFDSDGFSINNNALVNENTATYVAWQWKANGGTRTTNTESGNNPAGGYQVNTTAGFSIVDYTGTGATGTMAHGLGAVPHVMIVKNRETAGSWLVYHHKNTSAPETDILELQATNATYDSATYWNDTAPTSSVFTINTSNDANKDGEGLIAYIWTEIQGYSKFGRYTGNGSTNGPFNYCGFKPAMVMWKMTSSSGDWDIYDTARDTYNPAIKELLANATNAESSSSVLSMDILSNGFKLRTTNANGNANDGVYVFAAFAENPFVTSGGVPCTAR